MTFGEFVAAFSLGVMFTIPFTLIVQDEVIETRADELCQLYGFQSGEFDYTRGYVCYTAPQPLWPQHVKAQ